MARKPEPTVMDFIARLPAERRGPRRVLARLALGRTMAAARRVVHGGGDGARPLSRYCQSEVSAG